MADVTVLPSRGVPCRGLVDSNGIASNGSSTVLQLAARGIKAACAVDATGVSVGGLSVAQLAAGGIRAFCPVDENGNALDASTAIALRSRGIRPVVLLDAGGIALNGSSGIATLAARGLEYFCPVDEAGNATTMGAVLLISNSTVPDTATIGTTVGALSVVSGSGTYTYSFLSNPGALFAIAGSNLNTAAALTAGTKTVQVRASGGVPTPVDRTFNITVTGLPPSNSVAPTITGTPTVGNTLTASQGTWSGSATISYAWQWNRNGTAIGGATSSTYLLVSADYAAVMTVTVIATNGVGSNSAISAGTAAVAGLVPANTVLPVISGATVVGQTLSTTDGTWTGLPAPTFTYQWNRASTAQVSQFLARTSGLDTTHINAYTALINGLVADGVWSKLDVLQIYATQDSTTAVLNLVSASFPAVANGSPTFTADRGFTGVDASTTVFLDTSTFNLSVGGHQFTQNSAHVSTWVVTNGTTGNGPVGSTVNPGATAIYPWLTNNTTLVRVNSDWGSVASAVASSSSIGHWIGNRSTSAALQGYKNGSSIASVSDTSNTPVNAGMVSSATYVAPNKSGYGQQVAMMSLGSSLSATDALNFYNRLRTYMTAVGVP